jgi:hypothetical protein
MSRRAVRFRPPALDFGPAVRWMLLRAFGPVGAAAPAVDPAAALAVCRHFEVAGRVAARQGRARLSAELGAAAAADFVRDQAAAVAGGLRLMALAGEVAAVAAPRGLPLVFLKFAALELGGALAPGSRAACDLDVLVPPGRAVELGEALAAAGFRASAMPAQEHQLAALEGPGGIVEVHRKLLGVRVAGRRSATVEDLEREGLLAALPALLGRAAVPVPAVAAAHALVHGIAQHGWTPHAYSLLKMLADLVDLGFAPPPAAWTPGGAAATGRPAALTAPAGSASAGGAAVPELATDAPAEIAAAAAPSLPRPPEGGAALFRSVAAWTARDVAAGEIEAAWRLCAALAAGGDPGGWQRSQAGEALLLRHALAGRLDAEYERSLRLAQFRRQPSDRPEAARLARSVAGTLWLSRAQVDAIYGPPRHRLGYLGRQLGRPLDLLARLGRYGLHAWRLRRRRSA